VATWQRPDLRTVQSGQFDLVRLLDEAGEEEARAFLVTAEQSGSPSPALRAPSPPLGAGERAGVKGYGAWETQRGDIAFTIQQVLGAPSGLEPAPCEVQELGSEDLGGHTRRHLRIRSEPEDWIPAYLLVPKQLGAPRVPAMICLHQTVAQGKDESCGVKGDAELAFAVELVKRGYVCLAPDVIGFGERIAPGRQPYDNSIAFYRKHPNWSFLGKMVWDVGRVVEYLETLSFVDAKKIGCIGHSHGAYGTLFAAAFEPRIVAAVASCGFTTFRSDPQPDRWSHLTALLPQLGCYLPDVANIPFDWHHVLALIAPRDLFVWYTTKDAIFPRTENLDGLLRDVQGVYRVCGREAALTWQSSDGPHQFPRMWRETAYHWLDTAFGWTPASTLAPASDSAVGATKTASAFFPTSLVERARANARDHAWARAIRDPLVAAAQPWLAMSDDALWDLMFGNTLKRAWQVWSGGHCPSCQKPVPKRHSGQSSLLTQSLCQASRDLKSSRGQPQIRSSSLCLRAHRAAAPSLDAASRPSAAGVSPSPGALDFHRMRFPSKRSISSLWVRMIASRVDFRFVAGVVARGLLTLIHA
jgi:dienelactone hydrolase